MIAPCFFFSSFTFLLSSYFRIQKELNCHGRNIPSYKSYKFKKLFLFNN